MNDTVSTVQDQLSTAGITIDASLFPYCQFRFPAIGIILYLITTIYFQPPKQDKSKKQSVSKKPKNKPITRMKLFMFAHNLLLCAFSALCFYNTFSIIFNILSQGFDAALLFKTIRKSIHWWY